MFGAILNVLTALAGIGAGTLAAVTLVRDIGGKRSCCKHCSSCQQKSCGKRRS